MKFYFRLAEGGKDKIKMADNIMFRPKKLKTITMCPIPPFLKGAKCSCGKKATVMLKDTSTFLCFDCIKEYMIDCTELVKEQDVSIPITKTTILRLRFEWSINGERWYSVYGRNIHPQNWDKFISKVRNIIIDGKMTLLNGDYEREGKKLTIY